MTPDLTTPEQNLAAYLVAARWINGFRQEDVAEMMRDRGFAGWNQQKVSKIEATGAVGAVEMLALADILGIKLEQLKVLGCVEGEAIKHDRATYLEQCFALLKGYGRLAAAAT
jgi:hypothetical protein